MGTRILVVEDNMTNLKLVEVVLRKYGYEVLKAPDGEQAIETAIREKPDLILMDIQLPKISGYDVTKTLKSREDTADIPVIALTAKAMAGDSEKALAAGCDDYISKPLDTRELPRKIQSFLRDI
ncbi:MAG: response regulator [Candidatus Latescibacterota bacterium]|nr:MAG: response regulator [Candidatus Latescibacterota bacterium]RKY69808.1 MAG: response regulator [Candidatus Latescibacterota bacterium]